MAYENLNFTKAHMTFDSGYFYLFDDGWDTLMQRLDDGGTAFSYPLSDTIDSAVTSLEYDGINFWAMQDISGGVSIKRWQVENSICWLKNTLNFTPNFDSDTFTVEHYHTALVADVSVSGTTIQTDMYYNTVIVSGTVLTLGPNSSNLYEDVIVSAVSGTNITIVSGTQNAYADGDLVNFYNNLWIFNNDGSGALHKVSARTGVAITTYSDSEYDNITACTFARVSDVVSSTVDALIYVKSTNLKYLNVNGMSFYDIMTIDNLKVNNSIVIVVYDLAISGNNIYRLQKEAKYYGSDYRWTYYNYVLSTVRRFIDTVNLSAYPTILPANGVNVARLLVLVNDQYGDGVENKPVTFTDTDSVGFVTTNPAYTDYFFGTGEAISYYKAGISVATVTVEATATQYD